MQAVKGLPMMWGHVQGLPMLWGPVKGLPMLWGPVEGLPMLWGPVKGLPMLWGCYPQRAWGEQVYASWLLLRILLEYLQ